MGFIPNFQKPIAPKLRRPTIVFNFHHTVDQIYNSNWRHLAIKVTNNLKTQIPKSSETSLFDCPHLIKTTATILHNFDAFQCSVALNMPVYLTFIKYDYNY